jgi:hypothetical protein
MYKISIFENVRSNVPHDYDLDDWLRHTICPKGRLKRSIDIYRNTFSKKDKKALPCVTVSARFTKWREEKNIVEKMPFICLDIDRKTNQCVSMLLVKELFMNHPCCYYTGYSTSIDGVYAIMKIRDPEKLDKYFKYFESSLKKIGINIDQSCKDYARLRFFSFDSEAYHNTEAKAFNLKKPAAKKSYNNYTITSESEKVDKLIDELNKFSIDITSNYEDWIKIAGALNSEFGENGRGYFHNISKYHKDYSVKGADKKYDSCKKMNKTNLGSLFKIASDYGARY